MMPYRNRDVYAKLDPSGHVTVSTRAHSEPRSGEMRLGHRWIGPIRKLNLWLLHGLGIMTIV